MDTVLVIYKVDDVYIKVDCSDSIARELSDFFKYQVPGFQFMPRYKNKMWDGTIRLFNYSTRLIYHGLCPHILEFAKTMGYECVVDPQIADTQQITPDDVLAHYKSLKLPEKIELREEQMAATEHVIRHNRALLLSPTGSGKSLIIYSLLRWYNVKTLVIVPTLSLVAQMKDDFGDYSQHDPTFDSERMCHQIMEGAVKKSDKPVFISTWQSIYKSPRKWFEQFDMIVGDECHQFKAKSLVGIMEKTNQTKYKIGTTGTLHDSQTHKHCLEGLFGKVLTVSKTKDLMAKKQLSELNIRCVLIKYSQEDRKKNKSLKYNQEIDWLIGNDQRKNIIANLALKQQDNTLVLFRRKAHGKDLYNLIQKKITKRGLERKVFYVAGETKVGVREEVRKITENNRGVIIVASIGVFSVGVNIRNLYNLILATPTKSKINVLQSIGRTLRLGDYSWTVKLYDVVDDMSWKQKKNFALKHFLERIKVYNYEKFPYKIFKIDL